MFVRFDIIVFNVAYTLDGRRHCYYCRITSLRTDVQLIVMQLYDDVRTMANDVLVDDEKLMRMRNVDIY